MSTAGSSSPKQKPLGLPEELLICVFIHGFKGDDATFGDFPKRLEHVLQETVDEVKVESVVFPVYDTKGDLHAAVDRFADWLTTLTVEREVAHGTGGGSGKAKIVLCGHSMGGLLAADTFLAMVNSRPDPAAPLWPHIIACIAFDTPYLGVHPYVFRNGATKAITFAQTARDVATSVGVLGSLGGLAFGRKATSSTSDANPAASAKSQKEKEQEAQGLETVRPPIPPPQAQDEASTPMPSNMSPSGTSTPATTKSSAWSKLAYGAGAAVLAGAAAGAAYYNRESVTTGWSWAADHMKFVQNLWDEKALKDRVENIVKVGEELGVVFRTFYTYLPGKPPVHPNPRTFIILPQAKSPYGKYFVPAHNRLAVDEVGAHTSMFQGTSNDGYYELGLRTTQVIREAVMLSRGEEPTELPDSARTRERFAHKT